MINQQLAVDALKQSVFHGSYNSLINIFQELPARNSVYSFIADQKKFVLKIFQSNLQWRNELIAYDLLSHTRIPTLCGKGELSEYGTSWVIIEYLPGNENWLKYAGTPPDVFEALGKQVADSHKINLNHYGSLWDTKQQYPEWWTYIDNAFQEGMETLKTIKQSFVNQLLARIEKSYDQLKNTRNKDIRCCLIHRD